MRGQEEVSRGIRPLPKVKIWLHPHGKGNNKPVAPGNDGWLATTMPYPWCQENSWILLKRPQEHMADEC